MSRESMKANTHKPTCRYTQSDYQQSVRDTQGRKQRGKLPYSTSHKYMRFCNLRLNGTRIGLVYYTLFAIRLVSTTLSFSEVDFKTSCLLILAHISAAISKMAPLPNLDSQFSAHQLSKRGNWASHEAGVIVVFCIVFLVASGLIGLWISRWCARRRANRENS